MTEAQQLQQRREQLRAVERDLEAMRGNLPPDAEAIVSEAHKRAALKDSRDTLRAEIDRLEAVCREQEAEAAADLARADAVQAITEGTEAMEAMRDALEAAAAAVMPHLEDAQEALHDWMRTGEPAFSALRKIAPGIQESRRRTPAEIDAARATLESIEAEGHDWRVPLAWIDGRYLTVNVTSYPSGLPDVGEPLARALFRMAERLDVYAEAYPGAGAEQPTAATEAA